MFIRRQTAKAACYHRVQNADNLPKIQGFVPVLPVISADLPHVTKGQ
jgi:hypothetical protein